MKHLALLALLSSAAVMAAPQLTAEQARQFSRTEVLGYAGEPGHETADRWDPLAEAFPTARPDYVVDGSAKEDGRRRFRTIQAAVNQAIVDAARPRVRILVQPGVYRELVYVPASPTTAITLEGATTDASDTVISAGLDAAVTGEAYAQQYGAQFAGMAPAIQAMHESLKKRPMLGTFGSYTVWVRNAGFQARNITFENAYRRPAAAPCVDDCRATPQVSHQAVALAVDGADKARFENVRLLGLQDTLFMKAQDGGRTARVFFDRSYIEGDVDFIFGDATAFFYRSEIRQLGGREASYAGAPDTNLKTRYGLVFEHCRFTSQGGSRFYLARQWFHNQKCTPFGKMELPGYRCVLGETSAYTAPVGTINKAVLETVGKMVVLNSEIGPHIDKARPWSDWNQSGKLSFRPVQFDSDDYWRHLLEVGIDPVKDLGYAGRPNPPLIFLGEYNNQYGAN
ncbi:pectinesterase family protein [Pelomonas sp. KK5]|uniref:pectinesterase family protein n=1 Tax=Pelomonas sp. KK5 TaxID=1855730 RepID=UPI00097CAD2A|nr:pectinesterase family protein [Pelomonas sp. KK5]